MKNNLLIRECLEVRASLLTADDISPYNTNFMGRRGRRPLHFQFFAYALNLIYFSFRIKNEPRRSFFGAAISCIIFEVETSVETEHELFEEGDIRLCACENIIFGDAVHAAGDEVNYKNAAVVGDIAYEVLTVHKRLVLHIIEKVNHIVSDKEADDMLFIHDISAVSFAEASEHSRMAGGILFFGEKAAVMAELIHDYVFLGAEQGIEGLTGDLSLAA